MKIDNAKKESFIENCKKFIRKNNKIETNIKKSENFKIQNIEEDRKRFEQSYKERTQYISNLETKLRQKLNNEAKEREDIQNRLVNQIDDRFNILKKDLLKKKEIEMNQLKNLSFI